MVSLAHVGSWQLDKFYLDHLQPNKEFLQMVLKEVGRICEFLQRCCFQDAEGIKVLRVVKGGSLGKGTCMKYGAADPELFRKVIKTYKDQEEDRKKIITEVERWLRLRPYMYFSEDVKPLFSRLVQIYEYQKTQRKMFKKEIERRNYKWQKQSYLSDANLKLFSDIFTSYASQEKDWMMIMQTIKREFRLSFVSDDELKPLWDLLQSYDDQEQDRKKIMEESEGWVNNPERKPYSSDADLVLFLDIFQSYDDQEKDRKMIIEEIKRQLGEWQKEPYLLAVDLGLLSGLLESYRDQEKDPKEITQKIQKWLRECKEELNLSEADMEPFRHNAKRYRELEKDRKKIVEEMRRWRSEGREERRLSDADLKLLLDLVKEYEEKQKKIEEMRRRRSEVCWRPYYSVTMNIIMLWYVDKRYRELEEDQKKIVEEMGRWRSEGRGEPYLSNFDLKLLLDLVKKYTDKEDQQQTITEEIGRGFNECKEKVRLELIFENSKWSNPRVLQFKLCSKKSVDFIEFDVLPAYDAIGQYDGSKSDPWPYLNLIRTGKCGAFSPCFTELQRNFILHRCGQLKCLICLVKCWYNEVQEKQFPPKYALELLTVYAWEQGSGYHKFDTAEGFRTVLWLIEHYKEICIYWTKYYNFDNEIIKRYLEGQLRKNRPVILDPADPTANFGEAKGWDRLAEKAKSYASKNCCRKQDGSLVKPWNVPAQKPCRERHFDENVTQVNHRKRKNFNFLDF